MLASSSPDSLLGCLVVDALTASVAVLDTEGRIVAVNAAWRKFAAANGGDAAGAYLHASYLEVCDRAATAGVEVAAAVAAGIRELSRGERESFEVEYPCDSPERQRWFVVRGSALSPVDGERRVVVAHEEVTAARLATAAHVASEELLRQVLDTLPVGVWIVDANGRIVRGNPAALRIWGGARYVDAAAYGEYKGWWLHSGEPIAADDWAAARAIRTGEVSLDEEIVIQGFDGVRRTILNSAMPLRGPDGAIVGAIIVNHDVTAAKQVEAALRESEAKWRTLFEILPVGVSVLDARGQMLEHNPALLRILRLDPAALASGAYRDRRYLGADGRLLAPEQFPSRRAVRERAVTHVEMAVECEDGTLVWTAVDAAPLPAAALGAVVLVVTDATPAVAAREELLRAKRELEQVNRDLRSALSSSEQTARTDFLTGLANRRHFYELAGHELAVATRYRQPLSVVLFDADDFKQVNDRFGHATGDEVLRKMAQAATRTLRSADLVARHGGEELAVLLPHTDAAAALAVAEHVRSAVAAEVVETALGPARVTLSAGVAEARPGDSVDQLVSRADHALYAAKRLGRDRAVLAD